MIGLGHVVQGWMVMSDGSASDGGGRSKGGRVAKFKGILKGRRQFPVLLVMIVVLTIAMIYSLVTGKM
jgi:hypothetical protein